MKLRPDSQISKENPPTVEYSRIASLFYMIEDLPISNVLQLISSISVVSVVLLSLNLHVKRAFKTTVCEASITTPIQ